jgi:uncharacterized protein (DUF305 family)
MKGRLNMSGYLVAAFLGAAVPMTAVQERAGGPAPQHHMHMDHEARTTVPNTEKQFIAANNAAMDKMMDDMTMAPTGDIDRDFVAMMVPHHQGAIDMARIVLRYGTNEQLKRLAQEIIVTQQQEIAAMKLAVGERLPPSVPSPTQIRIAPPASSGGMHMDHAR